MLEDLKKEAAAAGPGLQFGRLTLFVAACVILAALVVLAQTCSEAMDSSQEEAEAPTAAPEERVTAPRRIDPAELMPLVTREVTDPDGGSRRVELLGEYAPKAVFHMRTQVVGEPPSFFATRLGPAALEATPFEDALGRVYEVEGEVVEIAEQQWQTATGRLWSVVLQAADGTRVVAIQHGLASDVEGGAPRDAYALGGARRPIRVGQTAMVRGYYLQRRTGAIGRTSLRSPTPVLWSVAWRER